MMRYLSVVFCFILLLFNSHFAFAQKSEDKLLLIENLFFRGMPPGMTLDRASGFAIIDDGNGHSVMMLQLKDGESLSDEMKAYRIPVKDVPGGEALFELAGRKVEVIHAVHTVNTVTLDKWVGKSFPDFRVKDMSGRVWTKKDILGKPFVLNFWHTGCAPCIKEMPELNTWMKICPDVTYFSTTWNTAEQIGKIVTTRPFLFTHIVNDLFFFKEFKVQVTPTTVLVDKKGVIRYWEEGTSESKRKSLLTHLKELSDEPL